MAAQEAAKSSGTTDGAAVNAETDEASDALLKEKEAEIRRLREQLLQSKAVGLDSLSAQDKERRKKSKTRRETWCGPAARKSMRMSLAPLQPPHPLMVRIPPNRL